MSVAKTRAPWQPGTLDARERERVLALADSAEAREQRDKLVAGFHVLARVGVVQGLYQGLYGHMSARVPHAPDYFWVNPIGVPFGDLVADDLVLISGAGELVRGAGMHNFAAFFIHSAIHRARPDVACVVHHHPRAGCAFAALGILMEPVDQVGCSFFEDHDLHVEYSGIVAEHEQAQDIVRSLGDKRALILVNHGLLTCASTIEQAVIDMYEMERTCDVLLRTLATGREFRVIPADAARQVRAIRTAPPRYRAEWMLLMRHAALGSAS
jgi:ribulose-5-phosphate 4-epimerase/fuculose-1-phosphate aldolase